MSSDNNFWFILSVMANLAQLESYKILQQDFNNNDLMKYLQHQDQLLDRIIDQNETIIKLLKGGSSDA